MPPYSNDTGNMGDVSNQSSEKKKKVADEDISTNKIFQRKSLENLLQLLARPKEAKEGAAEVVTNSNDTDAI